jgi:hypothetical protein
VIGVGSVIGPAFPFQRRQCVEPFVCLLVSGLFGLLLIAWLQTSVFRFSEESQTFPFSVLLPNDTLLSFVGLDLLSFSQLTVPFAKRVVASLAYNVPKPTA